MRRFGVGAAAGVVAEPVDHDDVEGAVGVAVAASVEAMAMNTATAGRDRCDAAEVGERSLRGDPIGVVASAGQQLACHLGPDTKKSEEFGRDLIDQLGDVVIGFADLLAELLVPASESPSAVLVACSGSPNRCPGRRRAQMETIFGVRR